MLCRRAWQRVAPVARRVFGATPRNVVPVRHMAFGVPGGSSNMTYFVLCGGGLTAAVVYAYKTVNGDSDRYEARLASIGPTANEAAPDLLTAVKMLANSTVEIAAASVGETSLMKAVQHIETDSKGLDSTLDVLVSEVMEIKTDVVDTEAVSEEAAVSADEKVKATEFAESDEVASDVVASPTEWETPTEEISAPNTEEEEETATSPEEPTPTAPTVEDVGDMKAEAQAPALDGSSEEGVFSPESSHKGDAHVGVTTAKSVPVSEELAAVEVAVEEADAETTADISVEETPEVEVLLGEATTVSDLEVLSETEPEAIPETPVEKEAEHSHSCHGASSAEEEAQPDDSKGHLEVHLVKEEAMDITHEEKEAVSLVNDQTTATVVMVTVES